MNTRPTPFDRRDAIWLAIVIIVGVAIRYPTLFVGPLSDDYVQHAMVAGVMGDYAPWDLYSLFDADPAMRQFQLHKGMVPWWTANDLYGTVFRPLPSVMLWLDHTLFPRASVTHHFHTLAWFALALYAAGRLLRRLFDRPIAWTAVTIYALDHGFSMPLGWQANRATIITAALGFLALWVHIRWREDDLRHGALWTAALMTLTFACGEYALVIAGYVLSYEVVKGVRHRGALDWARCLMPTLAPGGLYLLLHNALGYGAVGSELYANPLQSPTGYLRWAWLRLPRLWSELVSSAPSSTWDFALRYEWDLYQGYAYGDFTRATHVHVVVSWAIIAGAGVVAFLVWRALTGSERRTVRWLVLAAVLGVVPVAVAPAHSRLLVLSHLGGACFVAALLVACVRVAAGRTKSGVVRRVISACVAVALFVVHGPQDIRIGWLAARQLQGIHDVVRKSVLDADEHGLALGGRHVVLMSTVVQDLMMHGSLMADYYGEPVPRSWHILSSTNAPLIVRRPGPRTLDVSHMKDETWLATEADRIFCPRPRTIEAGATVDVGVFEVEVLDSRDGRPTRVRFTFAQDLDDDRYAFVRQAGFDLVRYIPPPVGGVNFVPLAGTTRHAVWRRGQ